MLRKISLKQGKVCQYWQDLSKDLPKFNARDDKVYQDIRREEKKEKIKLNPVKIPKGKIRDIESEWRKNEI